MLRRLVAAAALLVALAAGGLVWANRLPKPLPRQATVDLLVVEKSTHRLSAFSRGQLLKSYLVSLGREPVGAKTREGDRRTPEGRYFIDRHNPMSAFHRALHVSYPSSSDLARARDAGYAAGGDIMVHGIRNGLGWIGRAHLLFDWTVGCIAVTDPEIEELYWAVPDGTPIEIRP
jgi:murein L,D-transpeptidase YafK